MIVALDHDARQPQYAMEVGLRSLRVLLGELEVETTNALARADQFKRVRLALASVQAAARQLIDVQQDLIDAIRLELQETAPTPQTISASELISRVAETNKFLASGVEILTPPTRLAFVADQRWTERVLNNLLVNALTHSNASKVLLGTRRVQGDIVFEIRDNGRGMSLDEVKEVFRPMKSRAGVFKNQPVRGSGLGLYNVRVFVERMSGSVQCTSVVGKGTCFRVRLPGPVKLYESRSQVRVHPARSIENARVIAVLDDDPLVLRATERFFESLGVEVVADVDPIRWLQRITGLRTMPDLFLLDFQLGRHDCLVPISVVQRRWPKANPRIVVITANTANPDLRRLPERTLILSKPIHDSQFELLLGILSGNLDWPS